ncbi:cyanophycinase [Mangrovivirga sp. M17]|uniref:Cyanophycinase n=1 Tax=Mangrovivirga halotolerans TaxID=2993936 RepID=A0ABT3RPL9_9BACT|nr:cyanophycinase [Mangrovivirga halotolerans]MCX2743478.1 cyanophycinase [Mangrovivirga halotolerans]
MKSIIPFFIFLVVISLSVKGQGKLLLVGGGSEKDQSWGWSNAPYKWAIDNSENKKVAILTYEENPSQWLPDYFISLGATASFNVSVPDRVLAQNSDIYNLLVSADVIFIKGGDQSIYYQEYKSTKVEEAIHTVYSRGGVICGTSAGMAILGGVDYTAERSGVYPDQTLENVNLSDITLKNDFLPFKPGYIFDTHFTERGRFTRLIHFIARYYIDQNKLIKGIGVDDQTALAIDENNLATLYGTGGAHFYYFENSAPQIINNQLIGEGIKTFSIIHGQSVDLNKINARPNYEESSHVTTGKADKIIFAQEQTKFAELEALFTDFFLDVDSAILISNPGDSEAGILANELRNSFDSEITWIELSEASNSALQVGLRNKIRQARHFVIFNVNPIEIENFSSGQTGELLKKAINNSGVTLAAIGSSAKAIGERYCHNCENDPAASYTGSLQFSEGFNLISSTIVIADTYAFSTDFYENLTSAGHWAAINYDLSNSIFLQDETYLKISGSEDKANLSVHGTVPGIIFHNQATEYSRVKFGNDANGSTRQIVGFNNGSYSFANENYFISIGDYNAKEPEDLGWENNENPITGINDLKTNVKLFQDGNSLWFDSEKHKKLNVSAYSITGQELVNTRAFSNEKIRFQEKSHTIILVLLTDIENNVILINKFLL